LRRWLVALAALAVLLVCGLLVWRALFTAPPRPAVARSHASAVSAQHKMDAISAAAAQAAGQDRPVQVVETFTDSELSSLANERAQARGLPFSDLVLHATELGTVQGEGTLRVAGRELPLSLEIRPTVTADRVRFQVVSIHLGALPVPGALTDQVTRQVETGLDLGQVPAGLHDLRVVVTSGRLTISGTARPATPQP
jgi:hypothetical protein